MSLFERPGEWLRCQFHCHTTESDGWPAPAALVDHYAALGCDVLVITDHWGITLAESEHMLMIPGSELSTHLDRAPFEAEVLAIGIDELPKPREAFPTIAACADWVVAQGGVAFLAHPHWSALTAADYLSAPALSGLEIWNGSSDQAQGRGLSDMQWDGVLQVGGCASGLGTDDAHHAADPSGADTGLGWTMVLVQERTRAAVLEALRTGAFYATTGPTFHAVHVDGDYVVVRCSPASSVTLRSGAWDGCRVNASDTLRNYRGEIVAREAGGIVEARFEMPEFWTWGRVEMVGVDGGLAWSNPIDLPGERAPFV